MMLRDNFIEYMTAKDSLLIDFKEEASRWLWKNVFPLMEKEFFHNSEISFEVDSKEINPYLIIQQLRARGYLVEWEDVFPYRFGQKIKITLAWRKVNKEE